MRQVHVQSGPFAGLAISLLMVLAVLASAMLAGVVAIVLGLSTLATRIAHRLAPGARGRRASSPDDGMVIEGSYVVIDEKPAPDSTGASHRVRGEPAGAGH